MQAGDLPGRLPDQVWAGQAATGRCAVCGEPIRGTVAFELVFSDDSLVGEKSYCAHPRCLKLFEREIKALADRDCGVAGAGSIGPASARKGQDEI